MIKKVGTKYNVYTEDGSKLLGSHSNHEDAVKQLQAIEISKHSRGKQLGSEHYRKKGSG